MRLPQSAIITGYRASIAVTFALILIGAVTLLLPLWALVALLTFYAAALRADALAGKYGPLHGPAWVRLVNGLATAGAHLHPRSVRWRAVRTPYVGGDPVNYVKYAREMEGFYQPKAREPVFLTTTRGFLWLLDDQDIAVSYASATASVAVGTADDAISPSKAARSRRSWAARPFGYVSGA